MPIYVKDDRSVLFVHVPKAGGSTLERMFRQAGWTEHLRETRRTDPQVFPLWRCSPQHLHADLLQAIFDLEKFDVVFMVTREPLARFRSEYAMRHTQDPRTDAAAVEEWADRVLGRYERNPFVLDNHLRPQHEFEVPVGERYRLEQGLEAIVADLNARHDLGLGPRVPHALSSQKRSGIASSDVELSPRLRARLEELYAEDFHRYGY